MFENPSLTTRIIVGKLVGFTFGLAGFIFLPFFYPEAGWLIRWDVLLWYTTVGAIIGVFGVYTRHPILALPMPWWFRAPTFIALALLICLNPAVTAQASDGRFESARQRMVEEIQATVTDTRRETGRAQLSPDVMAAMATVPRHEFVPEKLHAVAYANRPLPVGHGQTISQPYIVALMTDLLAVDEASVVFEVGTGSGYQAAILAALVRKVYTTEIVEPLADSAKERLARLGYANVEARFADGYYGWPEKGPFDAIIVTAAVNHIPPPLVEQLRPGGRLVVPVGERFAVQHLLLVTKLDDERVTVRQILPVRFVPLTGGHD